VQVGVGIDGDDRRAHDRTDTRAGRQITGHFAAHKVAIGGDSDDLPGVDARLSVASQQLKPGESPASRLQAMVAASPVCTAVVPAPKTIPVGDQVERSPRTVV